MNSESSVTDAKFRYDAALAGQIEMKWQQIWTDQRTFEVANPVGALLNGSVLDPARKFYVMDMFPIHREQDCMLAIRSASSRRTSTRATCA
jgi:hypothetical protein